MFYKFLNRSISNNISELHPIAMRYLSDDIEKNDDKAAADRLKVVRDYTLLHQHFEADPKRLYIINRNYLNFLKAITFLYQTSSLSIQTGVAMAPLEVYSTINSVKKSFDDAVAILNLK